MYMRWCNRTQDLFIISVPEAQFKMQTGRVLLKPYLFAMLLVNTKECQKKKRLLGNIRHTDGLRDKVVLKNSAIPGSAIYA